LPAVFERLRTATKVVGIAAAFPSKVGLPKPAGLKLLDLGPAALFAGRKGFVSIHGSHS